MSMKMRWSYFVLALMAVIPMYAGAQVKMFEPERVGHWYCRDQCNCGRAVFLVAFGLSGKPPVHPTTQRCN